MPARIRFNLMCIVIVVVAAISMIIWPLLSAKCVISVTSEWSLYPISILVAIGAMTLFLISELTSGDRGWTLLRVGATLVFASLFPLMLCAWSRDNDIFFYCATHCISFPTRKVIDIDMTSLGGRELGNANDDYAQVLYEHLPSSIKTSIGRNSEFAYGLVQKDEHGFTNIGIAYGYRRRRWGVYKGTLIASKWPHAKVSKLYGETFYFVTTDY